MHGIPAHAENPSWKVFFAIIFAQKYETLPQDFYEYSLLFIYNTRLVDLILRTYLFISLDVLIWICKLSIRSSRMRNFGIEYNEIKNSSWEKNRLLLHNEMQFRSLRRIYNSIICWYADSMKSIKTLSRWSLLVRLRTRSCPCRIISSYLSLFLPTLCICKQELEWFNKNALQMMSCKLHNDAWELLHKCTENLK